jgi:hypothetical protein
VAVPFGVAVRALAGPDGGAGLLRREPSTELDHRAADGPTERWTESWPALPGQACVGGVAVVASDSLVGHSQP